MPTHHPILQSVPPTRRTRRRVAARRRAALLLLGAALLVATGFASFGVTPGGTGAAMPFQSAPPLR